MNNSAVIAWEMKYPKEISRSTAYISKPEFVRSEGRAKDIAARCLALCGEPATYKPLSYIPQASVTESTQMLYAFVDEAGELELNGPYVLATEDHGQMQRLAHTREDKVVRCYTFGGNYPLAATPEAQVAPQGGGEEAALYQQRLRVRVGNPLGEWDEWSTWCDVSKARHDAFANGAKDEDDCQWQVRALFERPTTQPAGTLSGDVEQVARELLLNGRPEKDVIGSPCEWMGGASLVSECDALQAIVRVLNAQHRSAGELSDEQCIAIFDAVTGSNFTREVKTPIRKQGVVRGAALTAALSGREAGREPNGK